MKLFGGLRSIISLLMGGGDFDSCMVDGDCLPDFWMELVVKEICQLSDGKQCYSGEFRVEKVG